MFLTNLHKNRGPTEGSTSRFFLFVGLVLVACLVIFAWTKVSAEGASVCASDCDFTTITDAFASGLSTDDIVIVGTTYDGVNETYPLVFPVADNITLDCQHSGATLNADGALGTFNSDGQGEIELMASSTIRNCDLKDVDLFVKKDGAIIANNTFSTLKPTSITLSSDASTAATNFSITDNTGITRIQIETGSGALYAPAAGTLSGNTITSFFALENGFGINIMGDSTYFPSNINITGNQIINHADWTGFSGNLGLVNVQNANDILFDNNVIKSAVNPNCDHCGTVQIGDGSNISFTNNYITLLPGSTADQRALRYQPSVSITGTVNHNTFLCLADSSTCVLLELFADAGSLDVSANYNLFYGFAASSTGTAIRDSTGIGGTLTLTNDYNGFWNFSSNFDACGCGDSLGLHNKTSNPFLRLNDADASNDLDPAPFSLYLDVNGTQDIGAFSAARRSTINIDAAGVIDYTTVDANSVSDITNSLREGDTIQIASGTQYPFILSPTTDASGSITVQGAGPGTRVSSSGSSNAILLQNFSSSTIKNLTAQNANSSSTIYTITKAQWVYNGNTYDQSADVEASPDSALYFTDALCTADTVPADGKDITTTVGAGTDDWNVGLVDVFGFKITVYVPDRFIHTSAGLSASIATYCGGGGVPNTVDQFIPSIFSANGDTTYSFNSAAAAASSVTLKPGETSPPRLGRATASFAGIKLSDADNTTIENVTSTNNGYGVWFTGSASGNSVNGSDLTGNAVNDVKSESSASNNLKDSSFDLSSLAVNGDGALNVYYSIRATVQKASDGSSINGAPVSIENALNVVVATLVTGITGVTPFSAPILATIIGQGDPSITSSGGRNPFSFGASQTGFVTRVVSNSISAPFQSFTTTLAAVSGGGGGGGNGPTVSSLGGGVIPRFPSTGSIASTSTSTGENFALIKSIARAIPKFPDLGTQPVLPLGAVSENIRTLQVFLNTLGFILAQTGPGSPGRETNIFGSLTKAALAKFQAQNGITPATGYFGPQTRAFIAALSPAPVLFSNRDLEWGMSGFDVVELQQLLILKDSGPGARALARSGTSTYFGAFTKAAVIEYQKAQGVTPPTGYFGPVTRGYIGAR